METVPSDDGILAWVRASGHDRRVVAVNFTSGVRAFHPPVDGERVNREWLVEVASDGSGEGSLWSGLLGADQAVVLRPA